MEMVVKRRIIYRTALFVVIASVMLISSESRADTPYDAIGIVAASKLVCRKEPRIDAPSLKIFHFGTPLLLTAKSDHTTKAEGLDSCWFREKSSGGWVYGGFLLTSVNTKLLGKFNEEIIWCNIICGGMTCPDPSYAIVAGDYYIIALMLEDNPMYKHLPSQVVIIGKCKFSGDTAELSNAFSCGIYDYDGAWLPDTHLDDFTRDRLFNKFTIKFRKMSDQEGSFYVIDGPNEKITSRKFWRDKCKDKKTTEEIWKSVYTFQPASFESLGKLFPLIMTPGKKK